MEDEGELDVEPVDVLVADDEGYSVRVQDLVRVSILDGVLDLDYLMG